MLGAGADRYDTDWIGDFSPRGATPPDADGPVTYVPVLTSHVAGLTIDGSGASYSTDADAAAQRRQHPTSRRRHTTTALVSDARADEEGVSCPSDTTQW